jgi:hypothetical protein
MGTRRWGRGDGDEAMGTRRWGRGHDYVSLMTWAEPGERVTTDEAMGTTTDEAMGTGSWL